MRERDEGERNRENHREQWYSTFLMLRLLNSFSGYGTPSRQNDFLATA